MEKYNERKIEKMYGKLFELKRDLDNVLGYVTEERKQSVDDFLDWLLGVEIEEDVETGTTFVVPKSTVCPECGGSFTSPDEDGNEPYGCCDSCGWSPQDYDELRNAFLRSPFYEDKLKE